MRCYIKKVLGTSSYKYDRVSFSLFSTIWVSICFYGLIGYLFGTDELSVRAIKGALLHPMDFSFVCIIEGEPSCGIISSQASHFIYRRNKVRLFYGLLRGERPLRLRAATSLPPRGLQGPIPMYKGAGITRSCFTTI